MIDNRIGNAFQSRKQTGAGHRVQLPSESRPDPRARVVRLICLAGFGMVLLTALRSLPQIQSLFFNADGDDQMRLTEVRDWLVTEIRASPGASGELTAFVLPTGGLDRAELTLVGRLSNGWRLPAQGTPPPGLEVAVEVFGDWLHATLAWNSAARLDSQSDGSM